MNADRYVVTQAPENHGCQEDSTEVLVALICVECRVVLDADIAGSTLGGLNEIAELHEQGVHS